MNAQKKYFGTDGIRGKVGQIPISADWIVKLGWALGRVLSRQLPHRAKVLIGKDTRISGYMLESALEAGLSAAGVDTLLLGPMPTPAIAYLTRALRAEAGIVVSASHNPYYDNGIKFFGANGYKLSDELELEIEAELERSMVTVASENLGKAQRARDAEGRYIEFCKNTFPYSLTLNGIKCVVDCAHGATYRVAPLVFKELGASVTEIGVKPNGLNINDGVGSTAPKALSELVVKEKADVGIALDGDGDRLIMIDNEGQILDGDEILFIIAAWYKETARLKGGVVGTQMTNFGLELAFKDLDIPFLRASVGDRYVMELLKTNDWNLGGESSGHIICLDANSTGDGIISALKILSVMQSKQKSLKDLKQGLKKFPQKLVNVPVSAVLSNILDHPTVQEALLAAKTMLQGQGRIVLRPSGTEPLVRVMVEGENQDIVGRVAEELARCVQKLMPNSG